MIRSLLLPFIRIISFTWKYSISLSFPFPLAGGGECLPSILLCAIMGGYSHKNPYILLDNPHKRQKYPPKTHILLKKLFEDIAKLLITIPLTDLKFDFRRQTFTTVTLWHWLLKGDSGPVALLCLVIAEERRDRAKSITFVDTIYDSPLVPVW